jgi:hypothetical protein
MRGGKAHIHRGRWQAQGTKTEKSESRNQEKPPTDDEGRNMLDRLYEKMTPAERADREVALKDAHRWIKRAAANGGVSAPISKDLSR